MEEVSKKEGRTILFVSHDLSAISTLTEKCLLLENGIMKGFEKTQIIIDRYAGMMTTRNDFIAGYVDNKIPTITRVELNTSENNNLQAHGKPLSILFEITMPDENYSNLALSFQVFNQLNQPILFNWIFDYEKNICRKKGKNYLRFTFEELRLYKGSYYLRIHLANSKSRQNYQQIDCCNFTVEMINLKEPEWGWTEGVCQVLDEGKWELQ